MTRNSKVSKTRILFTSLIIFLFTIIVVRADAFSNSIEDQRIKVNPNFIWSEDDVIGINPDNINITTDDEGDTPVIHYIVQEWDTIEKISKEFWVPEKRLKELNKLWDSVQPGQKLIVSDNEEWILYVVKKERSLKLFSEFYRLNINDLMTLNYISDDSEMLYPGQELFINVTEQRAYDIWLLEKAQPVLPKDEVVKPIVKKKQTTTKTTATKTNNNWWTTTTTTQVTTPSWNSRILKQWYYNPKISNWFAVGYCTWYAAIKSPNIFKYTSATKQDRPFGGNAVNWYANAKAAWFSVGQSPRPGAIVVYKNLRSSAWHVGIVLSVNSASWEMTIEDMNYAGRFIVTQRIDNINNPKIVGYIYQ